VGSTGGGQRKLPLAGSFGRVARRFFDVPGFQIRPGGKDLVLSQSLGDHVDDGGDRDPQSADAGDAAPLVWPHGDVRVKVVAFPARSRVKRTRGQATRPT
jgi:hypothetical protein